MTNRFRTAFQPAATLVTAVLAVLLLAATSTTASATNMRLVNYVSYTYSGNSADLGTDGVENLDIGSPTYQLRLELWAFPAPYTSGMNGIRLAAFPMLALQPGELTGKIDSGPVAFTLPPNGVWYFSMLLTEFSGALPQNDGYVVRHWINFQTPEYIGVPPPPKKETSVEFYHQGLDHYFIAASAEDIMALDTGAIQGWTRTGDSFTYFRVFLHRRTVPSFKFLYNAWGDSLSVFPADHFLAKLF